MWKDKDKGKKEDSNKCNMWKGDTEGEKLKRLEGEREKKKYYTRKKQKEK